MPGICGIISTAAIEERGPMLDQMVSIMMHEPYYSSGTLFQGELGLAAAWVCHKGSFEDCQPIWNENKDVCLIFSGEHFSDKSSVETLSAQGHGFSPDNASWLVHLYEELGEDFYEELNGFFCGVLVDCRARKVVLFNDRFGLNRIYWHESPEGFFFASEAKSLLKVLPALRKLDMTGFGEFFSCGCALRNRTLFSGVGLLPGGSAWEFRPRQPVQKKSYFSRSVWEARSELSESEYYEQLDATFTRILPRYFQGERPLGLSLTGGLDSRMIIAAAPTTPGQLPCFTFGGMYRECADVKLAKEIARVSQQRHEVISVDREFFSEFPDLSERSVYYSDGAMDVMGSVELFVNRIARRSTPVRLTGNYGSEVLRANVAFKPIPLCDSLFDPSFESLVRSAKETYADERRGPGASFIAFKQVPWHHYARLAVESSQLTVRSPFLDNEVVALSYQAPSDASANKAVAHRYIASHHPGLANIPTDRGVIGRNGASRSKLAVFCQEFMPRVEYVFDYGMPQWLAKFDRWMAPLHVERLFLGRQKFYHFRVWYRDVLAPHVKEVLLDPRTLARPYLNRRRVEEIVTAHVSGRGNYTWEIHKLLTSEVVLRRLIEQN